MDVLHGSTDFLPHVSRRNFHKRASRRPSNFGRIHLNPRCQDRNPWRCESGLECDFNETPVFYKAINITDEDTAHLIHPLRELECVTKVH